MASTSKVNDQSDENTAEEELSSLSSDSETDVDRNGKQKNSDKNSDDDLKTKDEPEDSKPEKKGRKLKTRRRRKLKRRESSSLDRTNSVDTISEQSALSTEGKKLRKRKQQKVNKFFIDPNGAIERKLEQKYVELEGLLNRQFVERKTNLTHLHIGQMEVLRQQYNLSCHGLPPTGVQPYTEGPRRRPHSAHHTTPAWDGESDEAYSAIRQIQQMSKFPEQRRKARSKSAKSRRETYSDNESHRQDMIDINLETASLSSARSPRSRKKRGTSSDHGSQRESTSPSLSPSRGYIPTDNQLRDTDNKRIKEWLRKKNIEHRKQRAAERAEKKEKRKESILKENVKIIARETGRSKVEEWMNQKRREAIEQKKAERLRHRQLEEEQKEREAKKKMEFVQGKSWMRPASAPASRSKGKGLIASSTDDPSTSTDSQSSRPVPHPPSSKLMYKRSSAGRVRLRAKSADKGKSSETDTKPPTEKSLEASQLTYSEWLEKKRIQDGEKKKAEAEAKSKAAAKSDSDLENLLPDLHKKRVNKVLKSKKKVDSGLRSEDETQTSQDAESPVEAFLTISGAKAELTTRFSYPRPQSAKLPSPQPCKSPTRPKSAHPRVDAIMDEEEKDEGQENPFHLPFPAHLGLPREVVKTQSKVFPERVAAERKSLEAEKVADQESNALAVQEINNEEEEEEVEENIVEEPEDKVEQIEEESPRVGASFFKTDPEEDEIKAEAADPVNVEPPVAIQEKETSFLDNSQEKLEPDKNEQQPIDTDNQNGNNNNSNSYTEITPDVAVGGEVNVTELPSEKIPTLEVNDNDIPPEVIEYKEDIFVMDSDEDESEDEEEDEENVDPEVDPQKVVEQQHDVNKTSIPTDEDGQQTIAEPYVTSNTNQVPEPKSSTVTTPEEASIENEQQESQYEVIEEESEAKDEQSETIQDTMQMTEQNAAPGSEGEHKDPVGQQAVVDKEDPDTQQEVDAQKDPNTQMETDDLDPVTQQEVDNKDPIHQQGADDKEHPDTQQEVDEEDQETEEISEAIDEEIDEEIDDESVSQDEQCFLDQRQGKHEPDKLEFLEQVMDSLPEVDDDSKGETSSLEESVKPDTDSTQEETLDQSASRRPYIPTIPNDSFVSFVQISQRTYDTEPKAMPLVQQPDNTDETLEELGTLGSDDEISPAQSDTLQQQSEEHPALQEEEDDQIKTGAPESSHEEESQKQESGEPVSEAQRTTSSLPPKPLTPTLGRHLSSDELLANIQAGKKLISIPDSSDENEDGQQTQLEEGSPSKDFEQPTVEQDPSQETSVQTTQLRDQDVHTGSDFPNDLDQGELDARIINEQKQLKLAAVDQIGQENKSPSSSVNDDEDVKETDKTQSVRFNIPTELQKDADVIEEQEHMKQAALDTIANEDLEAKISSSNGIEGETNTEQNISSVDVSESEKDTKVINDQETLKAETIEELNNGSHNRPVIPLIDNSDNTAEETNEQLICSTETLPTTDNSDESRGPDNEFALQETYEMQERVHNFSDEEPASDAAQDNAADDGGAKESPTSYTEEQTNESNDPQDKQENANSEDAQNNVESEEDMLKNLQERLQKLRSYDDAEFPVMHQSMHEPSPAREMGQEPDNLDSDTETNTSYQSLNSTPEPQQDSNSQQLNDSFKRGLQQSTNGDREKVINSNEPQNDQPVDSQSNLTQEEGQTEIPEELPSPEIPDNQSQLSSGQESLDLHQNGFKDQNSTPSISDGADTADPARVEPSTIFNEEPSDAESNVSSDEVNNNRMKPDDQTVLDNHDKIIESLSSMKSSIDQTDHTTGDVSIGENELEKLKNLENEFKMIPDNHVEQDVTDLNDNIKPILSSRDDNSGNDSSPTRQKKVSFSNRPIIIHEGASQSEVDTDIDSDAIDDVLRTMH